MKFMVPKMISIVDQPERALVSSKGKRITMIEYSLSSFCYRLRNNGRKKSDLLLAYE
jgi:hypothetical protein